jgi:hypothetical protein
LSTAHSERVASPAACRANAESNLKAYACCARERYADTVIVHRDRLEAMIRRERNPNLLAAAAVMLAAVSLGYSPTEVIGRA